MRKFVTVVAAVGAAVVLSSGSAVAASLITSADIKDQTVLSADIAADGVGRSELRAGSVDWSSELTQGTRDKIASLAGENGAQGPAGADGADGVTNLTTGAHYETTWAAGEYGETITQCPEGSYVIGGGYSMWGSFGGMHDGYDLGGENTDVQVTVSAPYFAGTYVPVNEGGAFRGDQWVVRGFNSGTTDQIVRAWAVCADVSNG